MAETSDGKLPFIEKLGYSLGDGAAQFVYLTMVNYQASFYTDAMGISASAASFLVLFARLWDAFFDPLMGFLADRTRTRWGRFRPWILWTSIPWAVVMVLAYTVPAFKSYAATYIYALVTNIALMTLYSMNNTPYSALMAVMTGDQKQRTGLSQYRFIAAMIGQLIVGGFTLAIMNNFGGPLGLPPTDTAKVQLVAMQQAATQPGQALPFAISPDAAAKPAGKLTINDTPAMTHYRELKRAHDARGWPRTMVVFAVICVICFVITFLTVRERTEPPGEKEPARVAGTPDLARKTSIFQDFSLVARNGPWFVMFIVTLTHYVLSGMRGSAYKYYFDYLLPLEPMRQLVSQWGLPTMDPNVNPATLGLWYKFLFYSKLVIMSDGSNVSAVAYGLLQMTNKIWNVVGIIAASFLISRFSKKMVVSISLIANTVFIIALYFVPVNNIWGIFITEWAGQLAYAPTVPLLWVLFADVCDFTEWRSGRNIAGFIYATFFFSLKAGLSLGSFLGLQVMSAFGYRANEAQTDLSKQGILLTLTLVPGIFSIAGAVGMLFYQITKKMNNQIAEELRQRRLAAKNAGSQAPPEPT